MISQVLDQNSFKARRGVNRVLSFFPAQFISVRSGESTMPRGASAQ